MTKLSANGILNQKLVNQEILRCPNYSQLSCRSKELWNINFLLVVIIQCSLLLIDSTGLKVFGQGEWHVKMHKASRSRTWYKLSLVVDPISQEIIDNNLTSSRIHDSLAAMPMISKLPKSTPTVVKKVAE